MPMDLAYEDYIFDSWEQQEQLYMVEVLIDRLKVNEDNALTSANPVLPSLVKIQFADFPVMSVEKNDLLLAEKLEPEDSSTVTIHDKIIKGVPDEWKVKKAGPSHYSVEIPLISRQPLWHTKEPAYMKLLVPKMVVAAGEALNYIFATLKNRGEEEALKLVQNHISNEMQRVQETGESKAVTLHKFSSGKSCLFHMSPYDLIRCLEDYPLKIQVYRSCSEEEEFVHTLIGEANVPLGLSFTKAVLLANTPVLLPVAAHVENVFPMLDTFGREAGSINLFVRLSCFGTSVFWEEENEDIKKQQFLKRLIRDWSPYSTGEVDLQYPWKKNLNVVQERPAPKPRLQPMYDPLPPPPPPPVPPFDMGEYFPELPRCSPLTPPPCYRRAGDQPFSSCARQMEAQLRREDSTKYAQTDPALSQISASKAYYNQYDYGSQSIPHGLAGGSPDMIPLPVDEGCTCPTIPPELISQSGAKQKIECTCAALMKTLGPSLASAGDPPMIDNAPAIQPQQPLEPPILGESDYEMTFTKAECGLDVQNIADTPVYEEQKESVKRPDSATKAGQSNVSKTPKNENEDQMPESVKNVLQEEVMKHNEAQNQVQNQVSGEIMNETENLEELMNQTAPLEHDDEILDATEEGEVEQKKVFKKKKKHIYEQTPGMYPGRHVGHKHCLTPVRRVPKSMGWLWTAVTFDGLLKAGHGWRPGSIRSDVNNMMHSLRVEDSEEDVKRGSQPQRRYRPYTPKQQQAKKPAEMVKHNPTLHIHKKEGYLYISMIPVKTDSQEEAGEEPKPIQFKIDPKHPDGTPDGESCYGSTTTSSDVKSYEMDFTAPIALKKRKRKVEKNTMATQYNELDFVKKSQKKAKSEPEPPKELEKTKSKEKGKKGKKGKGKHK